MANAEHLQILKQGVEAWNAWRHENMDIRPALQGADLTGAVLRRADLSDVDLSGAALTGAVLSGADLRHTNLTGADLAEVHLIDTIFGDTSLTDVRGLETCTHNGPSILNYCTLAKSGSLPVATHKHHDICAQTSS